MIRSSFLPTLMVVAGLVTTGSLTAQVRAQNNAPLEIYYGFTLIDGRGGPPIQDAAMAIRGNEILTVGSRLELLSGPNAPRNAAAVNLGGGFVIPGLIDSHVHLATAPDREAAEARLYRQLYGGITAVRDMAGDGRALASLARDSRLGEIEGPDVYFSALMAGPSFLNDPRPQASAEGETAGDVPWMQAVTEDTDLVTAIARAKGTYATGIKIYANLEPDLVRSITDEAHRQGMKVWAHSMVFPTRPVEVVESGVDVISHVCRLAWEGMEDAPAQYHHDEVPQYANFSARSQVFTDLFDAMLEHETVLDATLAMYARAELDPNNPLSDRCDTEFARELVQRAFEEGVPIIAGTDFTNAPEQAFPALHDELTELVTNGGLTPMAAIQSATSGAARAIGIEATHGTLEHGRPLTFVLLSEDPLEDIDNLRSIRAVWKNGQRFDRASYRTPVVESDAASETPTSGPASPQEALETWLALWRRYDLDRVGDVFLHDDALTYFSSDAEGTKEGFEEVLEHHAQMGFVSGGFRPERELWLEDVLISDFESSAVITAIWNFGNRVSRTDAGRGPFTMVVIRTQTGYRISHLNLANYPRPAPGTR